eukprot:3187512-Amphidinium_carterae.1
MRACAHLVGRERTAFIDPRCLAHVAAHGRLSDVCIPTALEAYFRTPRATPKIGETDRSKGVF